jgi:hypothetical protein
MSAAGVFTYRIADLGGANTKTYTLDKSNAAYKSKNFALVNSLNGNVVADNPDGDKWDLLFTKYTSFVQAGPNLLPYSLAGVKINKGCEVAERTGVATSSNDTSTLVWNTDITEIGADWKMYNGGTMAYDITADQTYFVRTQTGAVFKIYFTKYEGSTIGGFYFTYEKIASGASVNIVTSLNTKVYPNPASSELFVQNNESSVLSFELLATNGQTVLSQTINAFGKSAVNITDLTKGLYIARLSTSSGVKTERILID